jgi:hypothetical protein
LIGALCCSAALAQAQNDVPREQSAALDQAKEGTRTATTTQASSTTVEQMDTGESLGFMGRKLWFEVRKRLNLTSTEEEEAQKKAEQQVRLKVGSIQVKSTSVAVKANAP